MTEINLMLLFIQNYRQNEFFMNQALNEIKIGFKLCEYLDRDPNSKFEPIDCIKKGLLSPNSETQMSTIEKLLEIEGIEFRDNEKIKETLDHLVPLYFKRSATTKDKKRQQLLMELQQLDNE